MTPGITIESLDGDEARAAAGELAVVLHDCVAGGASVSFMEPFSLDDACRVYASVAEQVARGERLLYAARDGGRVVGTVQVILAAPPNQPHRGEIAKLLVHRDARNRGIAKELMAAAEQGAWDSGKTLLVLDTASGAAERVYEQGGWTRVGVIPGYALYPDGRPCDTTVFYKRLDVGLGASGDGSDQAGRSGRAQGIAVPTCKPGRGEMRRV